MQRLIYIVLYPLMWLTSILPFWWLYLKSDFLFFLVYRVFGYRKGVVMSNLDLVFPDKSKDEKREIARRFYQHLCDLIFETIKNLTISEAESTKRFRFENIELIHDYADRGKSVMLMCGHYASWEWSGILQKQISQQGYAVYKPMDNKYFDRLVRKIRGRFGAEIVSNRKIVTRLFRDKKDGIVNMTLILSDQTPKLGAFKHRDLFMGVDVPVFTGTEELAKKLGHACVYLNIEKVKRGHYTARFIPIADDPSTVPDFDITGQFLDLIEDQINTDPAYYLWSHKRWKHRLTP